MKIGYYCITSYIHDSESINNNIYSLIKQLQDNSKYEFIKINEDEFDKYDLSLVFVCSGGTENLFKSFFQKKERDSYFLLTYPYHNSLAAAMEILSFLTNNGKKGEILHGSISSIINRLDIISKKKQSLELLVGDRLGVIGKPSDWLIASDVNYQKAKDVFGVELIDIPLDEINYWVSLYKHRKDELVQKMEAQKSNLDFCSALSIYHAFNSIIEKYHLQGFTVRCFDLLKSQCSTGCIGLAYLNSSLKTATCEGDVPSLLSMHIVSRLLNKPSFQANPSSIDVEKNEIVFAHCTVPFSMCESYEYDTHFESGIGVGIKGQLSTGIVTVFKISNDLSRFFVSRAYLFENLNEPNLCRTQIRLKMERSVDYFLTESLGNHHIIIQGDYSDLLTKTLQAKMKKV